VTEDVAKLLVSGGGAVGLALLVHWHLGRVFVVLTEVAEGVRVLLDRVPRETPPA